MPGDPLDWTVQYNDSSDKPSWNISPWLSSEQFPTSFLEGPDYKSVVAASATPRLLGLGEVAPIKKNSIHF